MDNWEHVPNREDRILAHPLYFAVCQSEGVAMSLASLAPKLRKLKLPCLAPFAPASTTVALLTCATLPFDLSSMASPSSLQLPLNLHHNFQKQGLSTFHVPLGDKQKTLNLGRVP